MTRRAILTAALAAVMAAPLAAQEGRNEQFYLPGGFNWAFLARYNEAGRLFNAFDYGHAVLYERLLATRDSAAAARTLEREYRFLTTDLLVRPPRFAVAEEAVAPRYARYAWRAKSVFDWAHILHRQIYDAYADERLAEAERDSLIERLTDYYLTNRRLALLPLPKSMALMDAQPYSLAFKRRYEAFNGLIWAYHWLQVGIYDALHTGRTAEDRRANVDWTVQRFRAMIADPPHSMPQVMPMTSAIAPEFTRRHPRAAAIFDNLHMLHDIISDILVSDVVPMNGRRAAIHAALDEFRSAGANVMTDAEWHGMGEAMGGLDAMGGSPVRGAARAPAAPAHRHQAPEPLVRYQLDSASVRRPGLAAVETSCFGTRRPALRARRAAALRAATPGTAPGSRRASAPSS
jgi:hypothetical protein